MTLVEPLLLLTTLIALLTWLRFKAARTLRAAPATPPPSPEDAERHLVARLVAGKLDKAGYQQAMADLAHRAGEMDTGVETGVITTMRGDPRVQLAMLGVALPELSPNVLCDAFTMAQHGADADVLVSALHLTQWQAATIVASSRP
jgi:hypothetical protein